MPIQLLAFFLFVTHLAAQGLPPRPIDGKLGIQDERTRMILDERGRHITPDKLVPLTGVFAQWHFDGGTSVLGADSISTNDLGRSSGSIVSASSGVHSNCALFPNLFSGAVMERGADTNLWRTFDCGRGFSVRLWVKTGNFPFTSDLIATVSDLASSFSIQLLAATNGITTNLQPSLSIQGAQTIGSVIVTTNTWTHLLACWTPGDAWQAPKATLFVNGHFSVTTTTISFSGALTDLQIGDFDSSWAGWIDEAALWNRPLTGTEAAADYQTPAGP